MLGRNKPLRYSGVIISLLEIKPNIGSCLFKQLNLYKPTTEHCQWVKFTCDYCKLGVSAPVRVLLETNPQLTKFNRSHLSVSPLAKTESPILCSPFCILWPRIAGELILGKGMKKS